MLTIKPKTYRKFNRKTREYDRVVSVFDKYKVGRVSVKESGYQTIEVIGPKQTFVLCQCARPLKIIAPPLKDGENAQQRELPLFFVTSDGRSRFGFPGVTKIQGAAFFALDGEVLIPYRSNGRGLVQEL